jgi:hypothetical protein
LEARLTESDEEIWCDERRTEVESYLSRQRLDHGAIGDWPAWHVAPYVSIWAVESVSSPGWVGWWAICGDLPTDYCSADDCRHPRLALKKIVKSWSMAFDALKPGDATIGTTSLSASLTPLLRTRIDLLANFIADEGAWPE